MERLLIKDLEMKHEIDKTADYYKKLSTLEKSVAGSFYRIPVKGKNKRDLYLLVSKTVYLSLQDFLKLQSKAGVLSLKFVFGLNETTESTLSGSQALTYFGLKCGAKHPDSLKSTLLRKHLVRCYISIKVRCTTWLISWVITLASIQITTNYHQI